MPQVTLNTSMIKKLIFNAWSKRDELIINCDKSGRLKHYPGLPYVFTEQGIAMLASVLRFTKMDAGEIDRIKKAAFGV